MCGAKITTDVREVSHIPCLKRGVEITSQVHANLMLIHWVKFSLLTDSWREPARLTQIRTTLANLESSKPGRISKISSQILDFTGFAAFWWILKNENKKKKSLFMPPCQWQLWLKASCFQVVHQSVFSVSRSYCCECIEGISSDLVHVSTMTQGCID